MKLIESTGVSLPGKHAVVIGRSNTVGKPMALLLLQANATVTVCHSATADIGHHTRRADVVVVAVGRRNTLTADMVSPARWSSTWHEPQRRRQALRRRRHGQRARCRGMDHPVPGGVGPMTITMLLVNTIESAARAASTSPPEPNSRA